MKKLFTFLMLMISFSAFAQESSTNEKDAFNRLMFQTTNALFINIDSNEKRDLWLDKLTKIEKETKDSELLEQIKIKKNDVAQLSFTSSSFKFTDIDSLTKEDLKGLRVEKDDFRGLTFITPKGFVSENYKIEPYLSYKDKSVTFHIKFKYYGKSWVFHNNVLIKLNNEVYEFSVEPDEKITKSGVSEISDIVLNNNDIDFLRKVANEDKDVKIRFTGKEYSDQKLYSMERNYIRKIIEFFDKFKK